MSHSVSPATTVYPDTALDGPPPSQGGSGAADRRGGRPRWARRSPVRRPAVPQRLQDVLGPAGLAPNGGTEPTMVGHGHGERRTRGMRPAATRRARGDRQGRLGEQGATDEQVERPAGHRRREEKLRPAGDPPQGARQPHDHRSTSITRR
jgi:hypothetical protein